MAPSLIDFNAIEPSFCFSPEEKAAMELYIASIKPTLQKLLQEVKPKEGDTPRQALLGLDAKLPLTYTSVHDNTPGSVSLSVLFPSDHTMGTGRYVANMFGQWLIPGKQLEGVKQRIFSFVFSDYPEKKYVYLELATRINTDDELRLAKQNLQALVREIRLNILSVKRVREVMATAHLTEAQKLMLVQNNIASLLDKPSKEFNHNIFDHMQHLLLTAAAEQTTKTLQEKMAPLLQKRPAFFDRDIFKEVQYFVGLFKDTFSAIREPKHLSRVITYHYLFRKFFQHALAENPSQRQLSLKLLPVKLKENASIKHALGVMLAISINPETEMFKDEHLMKSLTALVPNALFVNGSVIKDLRDYHNMRFLYLEVAKPSNLHFTPQEIKSLKKKLPQEIKSRIEKLVSPMFMHRNEEEMMRNILILSKQLKYVKDIPQVIINFTEQTSHDLAFTVILLRLLTPDTPPIKTSLAHSSLNITFDDFDTKTVGYLRKKYPKEANVFTVRLDKSPFLRKDGSLDVYKARQSVVTEITQLVSEVRDYNGGMISKQNENINAVKLLLLKDGIKSDFLLENFFFSIHPTYMQSLIDPYVLNASFQKLLKLVDSNYAKACYHTQTLVHKDYFVYSIGTSDPELLKALSKALQSFSCPELSLSTVASYDIHTATYIIRFNDQETHTQFQDIARRVTSSYAQV